ncbi:hypothetical protein ASE67_01640 [Sphingomonas sp. Leaf23]|nr:hypothetical protein ASE67_01640 [Sphingomonas sp. Leaf23]
MSRLTPRERRCLELVALHFDTGQIATELGISTATVNGYLADARQKLGARNRKEAARMLRSAGASSREATPTEVTGKIDGVEDEATAEATTVPQLEPAAPGARISRMLYLERAIAPSKLGLGHRLLVIIGLVVALCAALAMSVVAAVGLVAIFTNLRP